MYRKNFPGRKEQRRKEALVRQEAYNKLTLDEKLAKIRYSAQSPDFVNSREYQRLIKQMERTT